MITISKGITLPIGGSPKQAIMSSVRPSRVGVLGVDFVGMKPTLLVREGDRVVKGQSLFSDKKNPGVVFVSPVCGIVVAVNRGAKRAFQSIEIETDFSLDTQVEVNIFDKLEHVERSDLIRLLIQIGLWTMFRTRPFDKIPAAEDIPNSIFINAMDTNPLSADPKIVLEKYESEFRLGAKMIAKLSSGKTFVIADDELDCEFESVITETFSGPHPAGLVGTHIHYLDPVSENKTVWHVGYQDVIAVGKLLSTGELWSERIVALGGPSVREPRLLDVTMGSDIFELVDDELLLENTRVISGSLFGGRSAVKPNHYLGRYHNQISCLKEGTDRILFGWLDLGVNKHSVLDIYASKMFPDKILDFSTSTNGSPRAMVPVGSYERVMPLDILPTQLLRALIVGDTESAVQLGALELGEDDLALCTYVCPGKYEYGSILRDNLTKIEKEL